MDLNIVIPTRNEAENIMPLVAELTRYVPEGTRLIFVDDSSDNLTVLAMQSAQQAFRGLDIHIEHRSVGFRANGLAGAVTLGIELAKPGTLILVMDGDLQHPPSTIPAILAASEKCEVVVASRYCPGGSTSGLSGPVRYAVSRLSTVLAKAMFPYSLRQVTDPMTGFFAVHRDCVDTRLLQAAGFKILLELLTRHPHLSRSQVPLQFAARQSGESKGSFDQGVHYLRQLIRLRLTPLKTLED